MSVTERPKLVCVFVDEARNKVSIVLSRDVEPMCVSMYVYQCMHLMYLNTSMGFYVYECLL